MQQDDPTSDLSATNMETELIQPIRTLLLQSLTASSHDRVKEVVTDIEKLSKFERLFLYMELPATQNVADPLRQPINPLGSRSEIQLTITWIKTHLEEDPQVSLPKHEVYDEYMEYCNDNALKALSTADFGKVMKQVYPQVRPRRLGTRGNSRYCYAGLRKKVKLEQPCTPDCIVEDKKESNKEDSTLDDSATFLILEWVEKLFNEKISSMRDLALFLIEKMYVDNRSVAAQDLLSAHPQHAASGNVRTECFPPLSPNGFKEDCDSAKRKTKVLPDMVAFEEEVDHKRKKLEDDKEPPVKIPGLSSSDGVTPEKPKMTSVIIEKKDEPVKEKGDFIEDEVTSYFGDNLFETDDPDSKSDKLSQLRQLLEKNLHQQSTSEGNGMFNASTLSQRRRVSFNPLVVQDHATTIQASPGGNNGSGVASGVGVVVSSGRKRHFSFQPISPRQTSLPQSPTSASPFISPRSTPIPPTVRSRHSSGSMLPLHLLPQCGPKPNSASSDAATFGSTSECSTPFISPHGTPVPFNRSRHNSAQGRLCRSRHSSGLAAAPGSAGHYRYNMTFSPMALNNLNNPYSPQPSTPLTTPDHEAGLLEPCRSRHSSAESEPPLRTNTLMSPEKVFLTSNSGPTSTSRQRHSSAGQTGASWAEFDAKKDANIQDDLDMAMSALKDCDKDFLNFVEGNTDEK